MAKNSLVGIFFHGTDGGICRQGAYELSGLAADALMHRKNRRFVGVAAFHLNESAFRVIDPVTQCAVGAGGWVIVGDGADAGNTFF